MGSPTRPTHRFRNALLPASARSPARVGKRGEHACTRRVSSARPVRWSRKRRSRARQGSAPSCLAPALVGMPAFHELVALHVDVPVIAHPAYAGAARVAPPLLLGKLFRWLGADAVIFPNFGGRFAYSREDCAGIANNGRCAWAGYATTLPVPAGGLTTDRVTELVGFYGPDVMLLIGGALLMPAERLSERTRNFVAAVKTGHAAYAATG